MINENKKETEPKKPSAPAERESTRELVFDEAAFDVSAMSPATVGKKHEEKQP